MSQGAWTHEIHTSLQLASVLYTTINNYTRIQSRQEGSQSGVLYPVCDYCSDSPLGSRVPVIVPCLK